MDDEVYIQVKYKKDIIDFNENAVPYWVPSMDHMQGEVYKAVKYAIRWDIPINHLDVYLITSPGNCQGTKLRLEWVTVLDSKTAKVLYG